MEELIQLKEIKKYFPWKKQKYVKAVDGVSLLVNKRDIFGLVGESGLSTAPHLHFELRKDLQPIDPESKISFTF